jgi:hypothetical protein
MLALKLMDSKLIYSVNERMKGKICWIKATDTEWLYFGAGDEVNIDMVRKTINDHFVDPVLYISWTRQILSKQINEM